MFILWGAVFVVLMIFAMIHMYVVSVTMYDRRVTTKHPLSKNVRFNTIAAAVFLFLAFLIPSPSYASTTSEIEARLQTTFNLLLQELPMLETKQQAHDLIRRHILPITNSRKSSQLMLGKHWRRATESQQQRFTIAMTDILVNIYSTFLLDDRAQQATFNIYRVDKRERKRGNQYIVKSSVAVGSGLPLAVNFIILEPKGKDWKIVDVRVEGISMTMSCRMTFNELIKNKSDIEPLIQELEAGKIEIK